MKSGIYKILNTVTNKVYIGSATYLNKRLSFHKSSLIKGNHFNKLLQRSWNKHGSYNFQFLIIEYCEINKLIEREQYYIDLYKSYSIKLGYNRNPIAENNTGRIISEETKKKLSLAGKDKRHTEETKKKISEANKGKKLSDKHKAILIACNKNRAVRRNQVDITSIVGII